MSSDRRAFLRSLAGTAAASGVITTTTTTTAAPQVAQASPRPVPKKRRTGRPLDVTLFLDVEDIFSPPEVGNDDSAKELADILTEEGLGAAFLYIGDRAEQLKQRGRRDVIDSMAKHEVGLHTRTASHPTAPEYTAGKTWEEGVAIALKYEKEGAEIIADVFGKPCCALSGHALFDSPHNQHAASILGLPYVYPYPAAPPLYNMTWYAGALGLPFDSPTLDGREIKTYFGGFDDHYPDDRRFQEFLAKYDEHVEDCLDEGQPFLSLFLYHPQRLRLAEFIDDFWSPNGVNYPKERWGEFGRPRQYTPQQVRTSLANFRRLAKRIRKDPRLNVMSVADVAKKYGYQPDSITRQELSEAARAIRAAKDEVLIHPRFSPGEIVMGLARAALAFEESGKLPASVPRDTLLGPKRGSIWVPELLGCPYPRLVSLARELVEHTKTTGHLPGTLGKPLERVGVNHLYRTLADAYAALEAGTRPVAATFSRLRPLPAIATPLWIGFLKMIEGDLIDPDLDVQTLYRDSRLQTWTMKPAIIP
jgi:peptidoglycan/xylan/chitin deacetylase (PgdA/CDA1 family)